MIPTPKEDIIHFPEDIPPFEGEYTPFAAIPTPKENKNTTINIEIHTQNAEIPPYFPEPGVRTTSPALGKGHGRDHNGRVIPHERDESLASQISDWVAVGATDNEIAQFLGLRLGVIRKQYKFELTNGKFENDMAVGATILTLAKSGASERMTLLYAKARMGWRESDANDSNNAALLNIHIHT